eukprot:COSAG06_NODE_2121_length_7543_cov_5.592423_2_plen_78_part_00
MRDDETKYLQGGDRSRSKKKGASSLVWMDLPVRAVASPEQLGTPQLVLPAAVQPAAHDTVPRIRTQSASAEHRSRRS